MEAEQEKNGGRISDRFEFRFDGWQAAKPAEPEWLIKGVLEAGILTQIFGQWGEFKTFVALDMALSIATGRPWHDHSVKKGAVLYINGEGQNKFLNRVIAWQKASDRGPIPDGCFGVSTMATQFLDDEFYNVLTNRLNSIQDAVGDPAAIFIDTLARNFGPGNESAADDMGEFVYRVDSLPTKAAKIIIHHPGHMNKNRARASSVLPAALDCEIRCGVEAGQVKLEWKKMKDGAYPKPIFLRPEVVRIGTDTDGEPITSIVMQKGVKVDLRRIGKRQKRLYSIILSEINDQYDQRQKAGIRTKSKLALWADNKNVAAAFDDLAHYSRTLANIEKRGLIKTAGYKIFLNIEAPGLSDERLDQ